MPVEWEHYQQAALIQWAATQEAEYPGLELLHAIPNGGKRNRATAARLYMEGVKAGVPDLFLPVPRGTRHGFYIEFKAIYPDGKRNTPSKNQKAWIAALRAQGYRVDVYWNWEDARDAIIEYLEGDTCETT